jgi:hypothetical protein
MAFSSDWLSIWPWSLDLFLFSQDIKSSSSFTQCECHINCDTMPQTRLQFVKSSSVTSNDAPSSTTTIATSLNLQQFSYAPTAESSPSPVKNSVTRTKVTSGRITKTQKKRSSSSYAPPTKYAHLNELADAVDDDILCLMVGHNPGVQTATTGHACMVLSYHDARD